MKAQLKKCAWSLILLLVLMGVAESRSAAGEPVTPANDSVDSRMPAAVQITAIAAGAYHTCGLTSTGGVKCWGANGSGQQGDGTTIQHVTVVDVIGLSSGVTAIALGDSHTCAVTSGGGVKCWGFNLTGDLGDGTTSQQSTPVNVVGLSSGVTAVTAGRNDTCALVGGGVKCWGYNGSGELGDGSPTTRLTPVSVTGLDSGVAAIAAGSFHTCALMTGGSVKCWGQNSNGQLGDGTTTDRHTPVPVNGLSSGVVAIAAGYAHTCAVMNTGTLKCWGYNAYGQLGAATGTSQLTPINVIGLSSGVVAVALGTLHTTVRSRWMSSSLSMTTSTCLSSHARRNTLRMRGQ